MTTFENANCTAYDTECFFPLETDISGLNAAKRVCIGCPVIAECLEFAMEMETAGRQQRFGVYGGMSPRQRADLASKRRKESEPSSIPTGPIRSHGTRAGYKAHRRRQESACQPCLDAERIGSKRGAA